MADQAQFADDPGTLYLPNEHHALSEICEKRGWKRTLSRTLGQRPLVWYVDDERRNRKWFVSSHRKHFAVLTFSSLANCMQALNEDTPCDVVVTDIFFPAKPVTSENDATWLDDIYDRIKQSKVSDLPELWASEKDHWRLDGFDVAREVAKKAAERNERIPVLLFSRKATLLLGTDDWLGEPPAAVENTFWLLEKVEPTAQGEAARRAEAIQRDRINAALRYRKASAPWWMKLLSHLSIAWGPVRFSIPAGR